MEQAAAITAKDCLALDEGAVAERAETLIVNGQTIHPGVASMRGPGSSHH